MKTQETYIVITTTFPNEKSAQATANLLIEKKLAACVQQTGPITSTYSWKNKINQDEEYQLQIKTNKAYYKKIENLIKETHPYEVPEIIATPIIDGSKDYLSWIDNSLT
jgi:periplasmic divalent cation tolerance protein